MYIGVNNDGYVVGLESAEKLLNVLPERMASVLGILPRIEYKSSLIGANIKHSIVPDDVASKPENLYV